LRARWAGVDPLAPADENQAIEAAREFTGYLAACRGERQNVSLIPPGRFLMPGELAGSPALTFAPLPTPQGEPPPGSNWALMRRRYDAYRDIVVRPFFRDHFARLDRQVVLVDLLAALEGGADAMRDLQGSLAAILECFRVGRGSWLSALFHPSADKILFAATKADQLHHSTHDRLEEILRRLTDRAIATAGAAGAEVDVIALAAVRATREAMLREPAGTLPSVVGVAVPGPWGESESFDGETEIGLFPGDLPGDVATVLKGSGGPVRGWPGQPEHRFQSIRFRPPLLETGADGISALPHIRLDRALQFLIGDRLR
jgi:hypothetical protein